jgi:hypothetical protein
MADAALADRLATREAPLAAYLTPVIPTLLSPSLGCRVFPPFGYGVDLASLCLNRQPCVRARNTSPRLTGSSAKPVLSGTTSARASTTVHQVVLSSHLRSAPGQGPSLEMFRRRAWMWRVLATEGRSSPDGGGERVDAVVVQADVCGLSSHGDANSEGAATAVPDRAPGGLRDDRAYGVRVEPAELHQPLGAEATACLLVGDDDKTHARTAFGRRARSVDDRRQSALHVRRAATDQAAVDDARLELLATDGRDDVIVAMQVEEPAGLADGAKNGLAVAALIACIDHLVVDGQRRQLGADARDAIAIGRSRRILGRDRDQVTGEADNRAFSNSRQRLFTRSTNS